MSEKFSWSKKEMVAHGVHLEGVLEHMADLGGNPGVGPSSNYGPLFESTLYPGLEKLSYALFASVDALNGVLFARMNAVKATAELYGSNESENARLAQALTRSIEGATK